MDLYEAMRCAPTTRNFTQDPVLANPDSFDAKTLRRPALLAMGAGIGTGVRRGTYSIVARDPTTGELGVAVQSHWFGVGAVVAWARPGVGGVVTQSVAQNANGPHTLDPLAPGLSA